MSSNYLGQVTRPSQAINLRVNDITIDGNLLTPQGTGRTVTQLTNINTGVTLNASSGFIQTSALGTMPTTTVSQSFTFNNSDLLANGFIQFTVVSFSGAGIPIVASSAHVAGSCTVNILAGGTTLSASSIIIFFRVINPAA